MSAFLPAQASCPRLIFFSVFCQGKSFMRFSFSPPGCRFIFVATVAVVDTPDNYSLKPRAMLLAFGHQRR